MPSNMRRDFQRRWKWLFIGRLVVLLAFTPEVRTAELAARERRSPNPEGTAAMLNVALIATIVASKGVIERRRTLPGRSRSAPIMSAQRASPGFWGPTGAFSSTQGSLLHLAFVDVLSVEPVSTVATRFRGWRTCGPEFGRTGG